MKSLGAQDVELYSNSRFVVSQIEASCEATPKRSTGETPFSMTYGVEVVVLVEISLMSSRVASFR